LKRRSYRAAKGSILLQNPSSFASKEVRELRDTARCRPRTTSRHATTTRQSKQYSTRRRHTFHRALARGCLQRSVKIAYHASFMTRRQQTQLRPECSASAPQDARVAFANANEHHQALCSHRILAANTSACGKVYPQRDSTEQNQDVDNLTRSPNQERGSIHLKPKSCRPANSRPKLKIRRWHPKLAPKVAHGTQSWHNTAPFSISATRLEGSSYRAVNGTQSWHNTAPFLTSPRGLKARVSGR
jgi:hypothetical protein